jgi:putative ATPase
LTQHLSQPLADSMRPQNLQEFVGQTHLLSPGKPLFAAVEEKRLVSCVLWGPPGSGKTTLARLMARLTGLDFESLSAVTDGVKEVRQVVQRALQRDVSTILFVDEVHRFNKVQQDAFLPYLESGLLILIGATTENPSFALNNALLSRAQVFSLQRLTEGDIDLLLGRALRDVARGLGKFEYQLDPEAKKLLCQSADGDARRALNLLESSALLAYSADQTRRISLAIVAEAIKGLVRRFDKQGDIFYDQISALHKSIRGSDPDAALYWLCRMLDGGCDPLYLARRLIRIASEDIGNADPRALSISIDAAVAYERLGSPEGELALAQAASYLAVAAKSNAVYKAFGAAMQEVKSSGTAEVPLHLRNAPTRLMESLGHGKAYRYSHDEPGGFSAGQHYFPDTVGSQHFYQPVQRGLETRISDKLSNLREQNHKNKRKQD